MRLKYAEQSRELQEEIERVEGEIRLIDEKIDDSRQAKDFVEIVITENKMLSADIKNLLKKQIQAIMANIFRLRKKGTGLTPEQSPLGFFITEGKEGAKPLHQQPLPFTKNDFLEVLRNLEANNIFIFENIQHEEEDLEKLKIETQQKIRRGEHLVNKILSNLQNY